LYGFKSWCLALRGHRLKVTNNVLRDISGPKWEEITGDLGKLHNEKLHGLYSFEKDEIAGACYM
jgi:hypothetical protein